LLAGNYDKRQLLINSVSNIINEHPNCTWKGNIPEPSLETMRDVMATAKSNAYTRLQEAEASRAGEIIQVIAAAIYIAEKVYEYACEGIRVIRERERRRRKEREEAERRQDRIEREIRDSKPMRGAEDHVDQFEKNRDDISRTC
jgi:hypothetical protein